MSEVFFSLLRDSASPLNSVAPNKEKTSGIQGKGGVVARWPHGYSALDSSCAPGSSPGRGHCVVFLGKTLYPHGASHHPGVSMGTSEFNAGGNPAMD